MSILRSLNKRHGFSLVELAIVLVIIGLLLAALVNGKTILENARIKRVIGDMETIVAAYNTYYDLYSARPGDDKVSSTRWTTLGLASGNGDSYIGGADCDDNPSGECNEAWQVLRAALMISGDPADSGSAALMTHPFGGVLWIDSTINTPFGGGAPPASFGTAIGDRNYIGVSNLDAFIAQVIDEKFDDGNANSGALQANGTKEYTAAISDEDIMSIYYAFGN